MAVGAAGETRTLMRLPSRVFETRVSTSSTTAADHWGRNKSGYCIIIDYDNFAKV